MAPCQRQELDYASELADWLGSPTSLAPECFRGPAGPDGACSPWKSLIEGPPFRSALADPQPWRHGTADQQLSAAMGG